MSQKSIDDIREDAKVGLADELSRFLHPGPKLSAAVEWAENWIDREDITPETDSDRLRRMAPLRWRAAHPAVTPEAEKASTPTK